MEDEKFQYVVRDITLEVPAYLSNGKMDTVLRSGQYESREVDALLQNIGGVERFIDIGACIGLASIIAAAFLGEKNVVCVEPDQRLHPILIRNFELNGFHPPTIIGSALSGGRTGSRRFNLAKNPSANSFRRHRGSKSEIEVQADGLNEIVGDNSAATLLMVDIEGEELWMFDDGVPQSVKKIILEVHRKVYGDEGVGRICTKLLEEGFRMKTKKAKRGVLVFQRH